MKNFVLLVTAIIAMATAAYVQEERVEHLDDMHTIFIINEYPDQLMGFRDRYGNVLIEPIYPLLSSGESVWHRYGLLIASNHGGSGPLTPESGVVDRFGNIVVPLQYYRIVFVGDGYIMANGSVNGEPSGRGHALYDVHGNVIVPLYPGQSFNNDSWGGGSIVSDDRIIVRMGRHHGVIDTNGNVIADFIYEEITNFFDGFAAAWRFEDWFIHVILDTEGNEAINLTDMGLAAVQGRGFRDGMLMVRPTDNTIQGMRGFISNTGDVIEPVFAAAGDFRGGLAPVRSADCGRIGFINTAGELVIPHTFDALAENRLINAMFQTPEGYFIRSQNNLSVARGLDVVFDDNSLFSMMMEYAGVWIVGTRIDEDADNSWVGEGYVWGLLDEQGQLLLDIEHDPRDFASLMLGAVFATNFRGVVPERVELSHWSEIRQILPIGTPIMITDVWTGATYYIASLGNGNHADVETLTAADTDMMSRTFGGMQTWSGRPVWVHVGEHVFAASIHNMPHHVYTIADNNMHGHVCLHFFGSTQHVNPTNEFYRDVIESSYTIFQHLANPQISFDRN